MSERSGKGGRRRRVHRTLRPGEVERVGAGALYGSLEMLILKTLRHGGAMYGLEIAEWIVALSNASILIEVGALYPALHRLERRKLVESEWRISDGGRRARFYDLTPAGDRALTEEIRSWEGHNRAIKRLFESLEMGLRPGELRPRTGGSGV